MFGVYPEIVLSTASWDVNTWSTLTTEVLTKWIRNGSGIYQREGQGWSDGREVNGRMDAGLIESLSGL